MCKGYLSSSLNAGLLTSSTTKLYTNHTELALVLPAFPFQKENHKHSEVQKELVFSSSGSSINKFQFK